MNNNQNLKQFKHLYGLIGHPLSHSFSKKYFNKKFKEAANDTSFYELFPLKSIEGLSDIMEANKNFKGLNVTIPYKEQVIPFLDKLDDSAAAVGAVNTIKVEDGWLTGFNTDTYGFEYSLSRKIAEEQLDIKKALVLGTGGASKAVVYVLEKLGIITKLVSRSPEREQLSYGMLKKYLIEEYQLIVNTTPLGMYPNENACPELTYSALGSNHLLYDLVYNPAETLFMKKGKSQGAKTINGEQMLILQAEKAWEIWNT